MMKKLSVFLLAVSFGVAGEGSIYSRYGVGDINMFMSGKNTGMANTGMAMFGETHVNLLNPASAANISRTILSVSYQFRNYMSEDANASSVIGTGSINSIALAFPVYERKKMVLSLGFLPYSSVGYDQRITQTVGGNLLVQTNEGRGGINSAQLSLSYAAASDLILGGTIHYLFGSIYRDQTVTFLTGNIFGGSYYQTDSYTGGGLTIGGIYSGIDKALGFSETKSMNAAFTLFTGSTLSMNGQTLRNYYTSQDTAVQSGRETVLPLGFSLGLAQLSNRTVYTADLHFQNWDNFTVNGSHPSELQNSIRFGAGVEFLPASDFIGDEFFKRLSYRLGAYAVRGNLNLMGSSINEVGAAAGMTFPMNTETRVHLGLEYGIRGTTSSSLVRDAILRFSASISASELMFIQPPIE